MHAQFLDSINAIDAPAWDALVANANPFVAHAFLGGMEQNGCIRDHWGWHPHHLCLHDGKQLVAAAPLYLKGNSRGEFVFDWSWAHAWENAGGAYYPKLLCGVPYSPVPGPRLLVGEGADADELRKGLVQAMQEECMRLGLSSVHANFLMPRDDAAFEAPWLARFDWQFHWHNHDYDDFESFLAALNHKKRKNIRHERQQIAAAGLNCSMQRGDTLTVDEWQTVHSLYCSTFQDKGNLATLSLDFFNHLSVTLGDGIQVALARRDGVIIAMALFLHGGGVLYGRYWGAREHAASLHFELCYYQGIEFCIARQLTSFEPGAQGEHKLARGFLPVRTRSRHYLAHDGFRTAVATALAREAAALDAYHDDLMAHSPYARTSP